MMVARPQQPWLIGWDGDQHQHFFNPFQSPIGRYVPVRG